MKSYGTTVIAERQWWLLHVVQHPSLPETRESDYDISTFHARYWDCRSVLVHDFDMDATIFDVISGYY